LVTAFLLWRRLPASKNPARFDMKLLESVWRFSVGVSLTSFLSFFLSQADRIVLSKLVTLEMFGYYTVAATANSALRVISSQITSALFPRFSALVAMNNQDEMRDLYHKGSQFTSVVVLPVAFVASFFAFNLFAIWTQNTQVAAAAAPIASLLFLGTAINSLLGIPYNLTLAYGWSSLGVYQNLIAVALVTPLMIFLVARYGGLGAAIAWVVLNVGYLLIVPSTIHRYFLKKELWEWYLMDIGIPLAVTAGSVLLFLYFMPAHLPQFFSIIYISVVGLVTFLLVAFSLREVRMMLINMIFERWHGYNSA
jgi:O-antigen/teichoic acid export membrane protein